MCTQISWSGRCYRRAMALIFGAALGVPGTAAIAQTNVVAPDLSRAANQRLGMYDSTLAVLPRLSLESATAIASANWTQFVDDFESNVEDDEAAAFAQSVRYITDAINIRRSLGVSVDDQQSTLDAWRGMPKLQ